VKVSNLFGKKTITSDAQVLGEVEGTEVNIDNWKITHLHISLTKEISEKFNFKKPLLGSVTVCLPVTAVKAVGDVISLDKTVEELRLMKEFKIQK
jgi:sporulation protein YlmC with PRC-barrel domain